MEPLSIATAVIGLLKTAQQVSSVIAKLVSSKKNGSKEIKDVKTTVDTLRSVLLQLQLLLLNHAKIDNKRASMIMVEEVVLTLTACVMTFSDLDSCVEGLESDERLGILDSVRWASKSAELKGYLQNLEAHKTSLALMVNILSCKSVQTLENDAAELKVLIVRVLESNTALAERMTILEAAQGSSITIRQDYELASIISQQSVTGPNPLTLDALQGHPAFAFEEDLSKSRVYQRSLVRGPRTFSIATSKRLTQITQSWSILSGVSLSEISNIAAQSVPICADDLGANHLYSFEEVDDEPVINLDVDFDFDTPEGEDPTLFRAMQAAMEYLQLQAPPSSQSTQDPHEVERMTVISEDPATKLGPSLDISLPRPLVSIPEVPELTATSAIENTISVEHHSSYLQSSFTTSDSLETNRASSGPKLQTYHSQTGYNVLWLAASLWHFDISCEFEAGYPWLKYQAGEIFDVIREKGELWLAYNQDDASGEVGWIWSKHFARLKVDPDDPDPLHSTTGETSSPEPKPTPPQEISTTLILIEQD